MILAISTQKNTYWCSFSSKVLILAFIKDYFQYLFTSPTEKTAVSLSALVFTALPSFLPVTIQACKYEPGPHHRSHLRRRWRSHWGRKILLDFTKEVNRWTQRREGRWEMDEQWCFSVLPLWVCDLSQASWVPSCIYLIRWIVAPEAQYPPLFLRYSR